MRPSLWDILKQDSSENTTFHHSARQWWRSRAHCSLRHWWSLDNGSRCNGMRATSPALKRRRWTAEADRSKPVAVLQCRLNTLDEAVQSVMAMQTRWRSSCAVVTLHDPIPVHLCIRPISLHWFHTCITVIAMSRYDKPASWRPTILPHSNALICWYFALSCRRGIAALAFMYQLCLEALHWLSKA